MTNQRKSRTHLVEHISIIVLVSILLVAIGTLVGNNTPATQEEKFVIPTKAFIINQPTQVISAHTATTTALIKK